MLDENAMILLTVRMIKKIKCINQNWKSNYIIQQNQILKMQQVLIHPVLPKKIDLANLKSDVDKLDIDKLKNVPSNLSNLKEKVNKLDADKLASVTVGLSKLSDVAKTGVVKKMYITLR